jgi:predicted membrane channel-forming protein YqfA (hemolysin III family)
MDWRKRWVAFRGRVFIIVGLTAMIIAMFLYDKIPAGLSPLVVVFGVGMIALAVPSRFWRSLPSRFRREDTWL